MAYVLDSNVFIQANNLHYGFDFCPAFWDWLDHSSQKSNVLSISQVYGELVAGNDELAEWSKLRENSFFRDMDNKTVPKLAEVAEWTQNQNYQPAAISTFLQVADYYLIAYALAHGHVVVTHEVPADSVRKIKIPNVCIGMGVKWINPFEMLRREQAVFILK